MPDASQPQETQKTQKPLPPGMVLGPDGKPCKICTAFRNWSPAKQPPRTRAQDSPDASFASITSTMGALAAGNGSAPALAAAQRPAEPPAGCPPDVEQLGRATWTFLHTTAAHYPDAPSPAQRTRMLGLLFALPVLYPCAWCATHLGEEMTRRPPDVSGRAGLSRWLCERHNEVNARLGKPVFDCALESTDERWKDGPSDGRCD
ncbi:ERV/ALR sulfhydryl oxidase domain-containing protein [Phellopilus nigrolimitatus]|nr:ERV/ALR sulfhydryl oxidase domain-containing protein [Phellopilus nigrolimitatus]